MTDVPYTALDALRELAILARGIYGLGERPLSLDELQRAAGPLERWVRHGLQGIPVEGGGWLCACPAGENVCLGGLAQCDICELRRPERAP